MRLFLAHSLIVLAAWTLVIKFVFPIAFALDEGAAVTTYVWWDFWWVAHVWLAWSLLHWHKYSYAGGIAISVVEIAIIVFKFADFLSAPEWTIWTTNWFINKVFVLTCFVFLLAYLTANRRRVPA